MKPFLSILSLGLAIAPAHAAVIYSDDFDDNTNTGWTYLDRSGGTAIVTTTGGSGTSPAFAEQNGQLEQTVANYTFPNGTGGAQLGSLALSGSGIVSGAYSISLTMDSLENTNSFQDQVVVFGYVDEDNFHYVETIPNSVTLWGIAAGVRTNLGSAVNTFSHAATSVVVSIDTAAGDVSINYGGGGDIALATGQTLAAGLNGVGSNNDAFAIDNYSIDQIPEPTSLTLLSIASLLAFRRRRS